VLIPMTIKYFLLVANSANFRLSDAGAPFSIVSCATLAAANSNSSFEIVRSNTLCQPITKQFQDFTVKNTEGGVQ